MPQERIDKLIASQGALSRSDVRRLVKSGAIALNGSPVRDAGQKADPEADQITVSGRPLFISKYLYLMLDKPAGVVSASRDAEQKTVIDLVPSALRRDGLFPAGRLDKDTTGFVLITNDGELPTGFFRLKSISPKPISRGSRALWTAGRLKRSAQGLCSLTARAAWRRGCKF